MAGHVRFVLHGSLSRSILLAVHSFRAVQSFLAGLLEDMTRANVSSRFIVGKPFGVP